MNERAYDLTPACWAYDWPLPDPPPADVDMEPYLRIIQSDILERVRAWQLGRCAMCAAAKPLVEDHDHQTGLTRGWLCRSCNTLEGKRRGLVFSLYRWRHPTSILGLTVPYIDPRTNEVARPKLELDENYVALPLPRKAPVTP